MECKTSTRIMFSSLFLLSMIQTSLTLKQNIKVTTGDNHEYSYKGQWEFKQRIGMWNVQKATEQQCNFEDTDSTNDHSILNAIKFISLGQQVNSLWASYYMPFHHNTERFIVKFSFKARGKEKHKLKANLDLSYSDGSHLFAVSKISSASNREKEDEIVHKCITIPAYGITQALMIHFIFEEQIESPVIVGDIGIDFDFVPDKLCEIYVSTFPKERLLVPNFLAPTNNFAGTEKVTFATQLTIDRLPYLIDTARIWQGPISAVIFILEEQGRTISDMLGKIVKTYYSEESLYKHVRVHIVAEDTLNHQDNSMFPVNFLRNVALKFVTTMYVFFVDADIAPNFSEETVRLWVNNTSIKYDKSKDRCRKCAFIIPVFHVKKSGDKYPTSKEELLRFLNNPKEGEAVIEPFTGASHSVVQYHKWYAAEEAYEVKYREDMEPYFVVHRDAPLMNDMYVGYGRDKCAYSRDLHHENYKFIVLTEGFLLNKPQLQGSPTIYQRSRGLQLRVFLTIAFHLQDLKHGHITLRNKFLGTKYSEESMTDSENILESNILDGNDNCQKRYPADSHSYKRDLNKDGIEVHDEVLQQKQSTEESNIKRQSTAKSAEINNSAGNNHENNLKWNEEVIDAVRTDGSFDCIYYDRKLISSSSVSDNSKNFLQYVPLDRKDILVENIMRRFGTYTYIDVPSLEITGTLRILIALMHPEAAIALQPNSKDKSERSNGVFHYYQLPGSLSESVSEVKDKHSGPATVMYKMPSDVTEEKVYEIINSILKVLSDVDVFVIDNANADIKLIHEFMCRINPNWQLFRLKAHKSDFVLLKSVKLLHHHPLETISLPLIAAVEEKPTCKEEAHLKTDMILFTKNRPVQTMAYLESLNMFMKGLNKVWIIQKADDKLFENGYDMVKNLSAEFYFQLEFIKQPPNEFGIKTLEALSKSDSHCMIFAVDEMIWLKKHDVEFFCCLLNLNENDIASVQLRLGKDLFVYPPRNEIGKLLLKDRIQPLKFDSDIYIYYPCFWPYDFGYVVHVDGLMMNTKQIIRDLQLTLPKIQTPGQLESWWSTSHLHTYIRKWHIMFTQKLLINNMSFNDGRVANKATPVSESYEICNKFLSDRKKIDVKRFAEKYSTQRSSTHVKLPVEFIDY